MKPPNLRAIDLNLLPILDALLDEKSVTLASARIHLSQSATSSALQRLRETFDDPIVIRQGQRMMPSAKSLLIREELKTALSSIRNVVSILKSGDDNSDRRVLAVSAPEHVHLTLADAVREIIGDNENNMNVKITTFDRKGMIDLLENGSIDIAIGAFGRLADSLHRKPLYEESMVVVMRKGHPILRASVGERIDLGDLTKFPHLIVSNSDNIEESHLSRWLLSKSVNRKVSAVVGHISMVAQVLRNTDLICLGTERSLQVTPQSQQFLTSKKLPLELGADKYPIEMIWHDRTDQDEELKAVRNTIVDFSKLV